MKKIGLLSLALVLALGVLGVGYAAWQETVTINQTVTTAQLDIGVRPVHYPTYPKIVGDEKGIADVELTFGDFKFARTCPCQYSFGNYYDSVTVDITNMFPCITVKERFTIGTHTDSMPMKLMVSVETTGPAALWDNLNISWKIYGTTDGHVAYGPISGDGLDDLVVELEGLQLHGCDYIVIDIEKTLEQEDEAQGQSGSFTLSVTGIQYNKYVAPGE